MFNEGWLKSSMIKERLFDGELVPEAADVVRGGGSGGGRMCIFVVLLFLFFNSASVLNPSINVSQTRIGPNHYTCISHQPGGKGFWFIVVGKYQARIKRNQQSTEECYQNPVFSEAVLSAGVSTWSFPVQSTSYVVCTASLR